LRFESYKIEQNALKAEATYQNSRQRYASKSELAAKNYFKVSFLEPPKSLTSCDFRQRNASNRGNEMIQITGCLLLLL
jgi:hypothetical protein